MHIMDERNNAKLNRQRSSPIIEVYDTLCFSARSDL